jgi:outer membrane lipoprotein-sorting protein
MTSLKRAFFAIFLGVTIIAGAIGAFRWSRWRRMESQKAAIPANANTTELRSVPPFSTREPERYQATRIITSVEYKDASGQSPLTTISKTLIARDGEKRREEYESGLGRTLVYLENPDGRFILSPVNKLYADLTASPAESNPDAGSVAPTGTSDFSPERLLNETPALARYENLGGDRINERNTTKYRVTPRDATTGNNAGSVTLIWIDNALGLPVRSETSSTAGDHPARLTVELRDLKAVVDSRVFELPKDYRKVDYRRFFIESGLTPLVSGNEGTASAKP